MNFVLYAEDESTLIAEISLDSEQHQQVRVGKHAVVNLISINLSQALPLNTLLSYNFLFSNNDQQQSLIELMPELLYSGKRYPNFAIKSDVKQLLHGSCRKPHFDSGDGLVQVDHVIAAAINNAEQRPAMLMMSGDQIYADDVAGPTLVAIHQVIALLGLYEEQWQGTVVNSSEELFSSSLCYYQRDQLLPHDSANKAVYDKIFAASKKPIFTSVNAKNHLVTLAEVFAMYLLTWSPVMWRFVDLKDNNVAEEFSAIYLNDN